MGAASEGRFWVACPHSIGVRPGKGRLKMPKLHDIGVAGIIANLAENRPGSVVKADLWQVPQHRMEMDGAGPDNAKEIADDQRMDRRSSGGKHGGGYSVNGGDAA